MTDKTKEATEQEREWFKRFMGVPVKEQSNKRIITEVLLWTVGVTALLTIIGIVI